VSKIARDLKCIAREFNIPVVAVSQLSRAVEQRQDKRPQLSDLRESGAIEQEADVVLLMYREDYYKKGKEKEQQGIVPVEIEVAKNRNGALTTVVLNFDKKTNRFNPKQIQEVEFSGR
jgi:replicative DNA helicase